MRHASLVPVICVALIFGACEQPAESEITNNDVGQQDTTAVTQIAPHDEPQPDLNALATGFRDIDPNDPPAGSPIARALTYVDDAYVHIVYSQPYLRGREAFGEIVPYGEVWAAGAHFTTEMLATAPIHVEGNRLDAGVYSIFVTPEEDEWTIHFNSELGSHMTGRYSADNDILTVQVPVEEPGESIDPFTIEFADNGNGRTLTIGWQNAQVSLSLEPASE